MKAKWILGLALCLSILSCKVEEDIILKEEIPLIEERQAFPESWVGNYSGKLILGTELPSGETELDMELNIQPTDSTGVYRWNIVYKTEKPDSREYELIIVDKEKGLYKIDERNSIILDCFHSGNKLMSRFAVQGSLALATYEKKGDYILFEIIMGKTETTKTGGQDKIPEVENYGINVRQYAVLKKGD